jgi:hypothetical protein
VKKSTARPRPHAPRPTITSPPVPANDPNYDPTDEELEQVTGAHAFGSLMSSSTTMDPLQLRALVLMYVIRTRQYQQVYRQSIRDVARQRVSWMSEKISESDDIEMHESIAKPPAFPEESLQWPSIKKAWDRHTESAEKLLAGLAANLELPDPPWELDQDWLVVKYEDVMVLVYLGLPEPHVSVYPVSRIIELRNLDVPDADKLSEDMVTALSRVASPN